MFSLYYVNEQDDDEMTERPSRNRYRYVSELYLAAFLYYTNKFGDEDLTWARDRLFAWAYTLRVELLRLQFRSIDKRARDGGSPTNVSAFGLMRTAESGRVIRQLPVPNKPYSETHEKALLAILKKSGT